MARNLAGLRGGPRRAGLDHYLGRVALFWVGAALLFGGFLLRQSAIMTLGRLHTMNVTTRAGQLVVEADPYRLIHHPSHTAAKLAAAGILLCSTTGFHWLVMYLLWQRHILYGVTFGLVAFALLRPRLTATSLRQEPD